LATSLFGAFCHAEGGLNTSFCFGVVNKYVPDAFKMGFGQIRMDIVQLYLSNVNYKTDKIFFLQAIHV
jgi:hypothetical protein